MTPTNWVHAAGWTMCVLGCLAGLLTFFIMILGSSGGITAAEQAGKAATATGIAAVALLVVGFILTIVVVP